jgi:hypothetical protein
MALTQQAIDALVSMGEQIGLAWQANTRKTRGTDDVLNICIGDGIAPTKIDGWIHACTLTAKAMIKYAADPDRGLDIVGVTSWSGGNSALRYARWQCDFHWKIDTRPWQFFLYMYPMKWAFRDAIQGHKTLSDADRAALLDVNEDFWEVVVVAYTYRAEVIERSRGFAVHPDPTCGAAWQGYPYRKIWDREEVKFEDLAMPFIEKGKSDYERVEGKIEPKPFPALENQMEPGLPTTCWQWIEVAKSRGLSDQWLRVQLGKRWVPTRFNGWWSSVEEVLRFLEPFAHGQLATVEGGERSEQGGFDLRDYAVRFGLCHAEFQRRLDGEARQIIGLVDSARDALKAISEERGLSAEAIDGFIERSARVMGQVFENSVAVSEDEIPELNVARPIHPRYAPVDPLEPLHWQVADPARYRRKMALLGYTL